MQPHTEPRPLEGLRLGVIGPSSREAHYRQIIEDLGAKFDFAPSEEKLGTIKRLCTRSDGIVFVTSYTSHKVEDHLRGPERKGLPVCRLHQKGLERLREAALELQQRMQAYRHPEPGSGSKPRG